MVGETSVREVYGEMDCGQNPRLEVLGGGSTEREEIRNTVVPTVVSPTQLRINSEVTVAPSAAGGNYSFTYVFIASPY